MTDLKQPRAAPVVQLAGHECGGLDRFADVIASSSAVSAEDPDAAQSTEHGGVDGAVRGLDGSAASYLEQLNAELTA